MQFKYTRVGAIPTGFRYAAAAAFCSMNSNLNWSGLKYTAEQGCGHPPLTANQPTTPKKKKKKTKLDLTERFYTGSTAASVRAKENLGKKSFALMLFI